MNIRHEETSTKPRIAYVVPGLDRGGCEIHLLAILPQLQQWFSVQLFVFHENWGTLGHLFEAKDIKVTCLLPPQASQYTKIRRWIQGTLCLRYHLSSPVDIIHGFLPLGYYGAGLAYLLGGKSTHFIMSRRALNTYIVHRYLTKKMEKFLHRHVCMAFGNSSEVCKQLIEEGIPVHKVHKIFNGLPLGHCQEQTHESKAHLFEPLPVGWVAIIYIANFMSYKGHADLIPVAHKLLALGHEKFCFILAGRDQDQRIEYLKNQVQNQGLKEHFRFLGEVLHPTALLKHADIGVFPSHQEGFSNSLLEKMAQGLAVVATDVGGNKDAIYSGKNGYLFPVGNIELMAHFLALLISDPLLRMRIGKAAAETVHSVFTLKQCVNAYRVLYEKILSECKH